jgi:hypothetical protein
MTVIPNPNVPSDESRTAPDLAAFSNLNAANMAQQHCLYPAATGLG